jgi:hypothetical protein
MSKASIRGNLTSFNAGIAAIKAKGLKYILGYASSFRLLYCFQANYSIFAK